ncbi:MFS transporter [Corynebacterium sp. sy017]|uniref:MFS transporter n=1 Tax=unclassified Corynebacterium TaxID=2624378 RepID=UPI001186E710|nr:MULTISPECIES: MFS transporter [unclassified Corynebacterium]MBP3088090.1 MFS transporter [Corynebacterium sp. sy017]TSD92614.1 MFS transporter [Corynebacterium sp. SY003]
MTSSHAHNLSKPTANVSSPKAAVPILLFCFVFSLVVDNGFKFMTKPIAEDLSLSPSTASLQATLAGIVIGIGAVVYAALADAISIRKLMIAGISMVALGSILGFAFQNVWPMVLAGRVIQTTGLAAAETLYVIYVTKYLSEKDQKTYLGFSTSSFQAAMLIGTLTSGFIATYISWTAMFLISCALVLAIPFLIKTVPPQAKTSAHVDILGLLFIAVIATSVILYIQAFNAVFLIPIAVGIVLFAAHVKYNKNALVKPEFFSNAQYILILLIVLIVYSVQLGYTAILLPYMVDSLHGINLSGASYILAPGYICAILAGIFAGRVGRVLSSHRTIILGLVLITAALILPAIFIDAPVAVLVVSMILFPTGFATIYAPLVSTSVSRISAEKSGVAIGFYNLTINIAIPVGIAYSAKLLELAPTGLAFLSYVPGGAATPEQQTAATLLWILAFIALGGMVLYLATSKIIHRTGHTAAGAEN